MTNFIFKSQGTYKKLCQQLEMVQTELRHQRSEHAVILRQLLLILNDKKVIDQTLDYYNKYGEDETSPQTDSDEQ